MVDKSELVELTADIVVAYVGSSAIATPELPLLIQAVYCALNGLSAEQAPALIEKSQPPAIAIKKSITPDALICLEDGRKFKSLKRHLRTKYALSPEDYRAKWGLPADYPMVAPNYAAARSALAKQIGLGQGGRRKSKSPAKSPKAK